MPRGRWYPSQVLQPDGRVVIMDGFDESGTPAKNETIELFTPSPDLNGVGRSRRSPRAGGPASRPTRASSIPATS